MKTIKFLFTAFAVFGTIGAFAQSAIGLRGGINIANVTEVQELGDLSPKSITGLNLGVYAELGLSPLLAIQPELIFLQKGSQVEGLDLEENTDVHVKMVINYLEVPVLAKVRFGTEKFKGYAVAGPSIGYALGGKGSFTIDGVKVTDDIEFDNDLDDDGVKDRRWDYSAVVGVGGLYAVGPGSIVLDVRYQHDFTDFSKFKNDEPSGYKKTFNRGVALSVGYQIPLAK